MPSTVLMYSADNKTVMCTAPEIKLQYGTEVIAEIIIHSLAVIPFRLLVPNRPHMKSLSIKILNGIKSVPIRTCLI